MAKYRFFRTDFSGTFEIEIFKVGRNNGFVATGDVKEVLSNENRENFGWYCFGTLKEHRKELPQTREIKQSTARKLLRRCPVKVYERVMEKYNANRRENS